MQLHEALLPLSSKTSLLKKLPFIDLYFETPGSLSPETVNL